MGKRKVRFDTRKNYERKKYGLRVSIPLNLIRLPSGLIVRLPIAAYSSSTLPSASALISRFSKSNLVPPGWSEARLLDEADSQLTPSQNPCFALYKVRVLPPLFTASVGFTLTVGPQCTWTLRLGSQEINPQHCQLLTRFAPKLCSIDAVLELLSVLDASKVCPGNADDKFMKLIDHHKGSFKDQSGTQIVAYRDTQAFPHPTIRHSQCTHISESAARCQKCADYRLTLRVLASRESHPRSDRTGPSSHTNYRYLSTPEKIDRLHNLHQESRSSQKKLERLRAKLAEITASKGVPLDDHTTSDLRQIMQEEEEHVLSRLPQDSFKHIFWQQQKEAASRKDKRGMCWHPAMIKWCLYLRHQSNKAYETLRESGCIQLPSQRTLHDYTHCVKSGAGFSANVDRQLMQAAKVASCHEWQKLMIILIDEMYIRDDLVYEKHTGNLIGFSDLGEVNNHLLAFERSLDQDQAAENVLAKSMMVFMVRGLFTPLRFAYVQFPCSKVTGDLLFHPFWQAVYRLERMTFKVLGATFDGASVNRRLVKIHNTAADFIYKVRNVHAEDGKELFFFSDPPHLIKTTRNCWSSKCRSLWCNGSSISWRHLVDLYERDRGKATGLALVPKLKYEHIHLSSFSKMRVDLAAQVLSESVAKALTLTLGPEAAETAKFVSMFDKFFDLLNVSNFTNGTRYRKPFQHPYRSSDDHRLKWLEEEFLPYLEEWERSVKARTGFNKTQKSRMLVSAETLLGLRMTANSFVGLVRYLFSLPMVKENRLAFLSQHLCQDPLEKFFGCQRQRGGTSDNPSTMEFYRNTQALRVVNSFCRGPAKGNCRGAVEEISDKENTPLQRRRSSNFCHTV